MRKRPLIGIAPYIVLTKSKREMIGTYLTYVRALERAGADCLVLNPNRHFIPTYMKLLDGILLTGGDDIHPKFFGQKMGAFPVELSPDDRTRFEIAVVRAFLKARRPILGICLGCQTINVALGGNIIQDLLSQRPCARNHKKGNHSILIQPNSLLFRIVGKRLIRVNTRHHQSNDRPGKGINISAASPDGVVEAIEVRNHPFALGIQWHLEESPKKTESRRIFRAFVRACERR